MASELWSAARSQLSDFEQRSAAIALQLHSEKDALVGVEAATAKLNEDKAAVVQSLQQLEQRKETVRAELARLSDQAAREEESTGVLTRQLALYQSAREEAARAMEADTRRYQEHLAMQRRQLESMRQFLAGAQ